MRKYGVTLMLITLLAFLLSACSHQPSYGTPPPINKLKWGMNVKEAFHVLGIAEKDTTQTTLGTTRTFIAKEQIKINNRLAEVSFTFDDYFAEPVLIGITALFNPEDVEYVEKEITKQRGQGEYQYTATSEALRATWNDDKLETNERWKAAVEEIYRNNGVKITDDPLKDGVSVDYKPITSCNLTLDKSSPLYGRVSYSGEVAAMLNYPEKFAPKP
ncbi:hypothetical protein [Paenibacillus glycanilyticus]|uniref:Uncharacterized protein n=1 Tax=Paenibacillus glycanilyticus TaxID=126569 RepID=A0ABQ6G575_9BACL|nr:hypothetical protein [Paenibacillus glycanilyticus]GLX66104.1 hypothetical protein MU1_04480 [Paenibacillus glycanilyticus]